MGLLKSMVLRQVQNLTCAADAKQVQENLRLYVELTTFRKSLLSLAGSVFADSNLTHGAQLAIDETLLNMNKNDKAWMSFYGGGSNKYDRLLLRTNMDITGRHVTKYLKSLGIDPNRQNALLASQDQCYRMSRDRDGRDEFVYIDDDHVAVDGSHSRAAIFRILKSPGASQIVFHLVDPQEPNDLVLIGIAEKDQSEYIRTSKCKPQKCGTLFGTFNAVQLTNAAANSDDQPYMFQEITSGCTGPLYFDGSWMYGNGADPSEFGNSQQAWFLWPARCIGALNHEVYATLISSYTNLNSV